LIEENEAIKKIIKASLEEKFDAELTEHIGCEKYSFTDIAILFVADF